MGTSTDAILVYGIPLDEFEDCNYSDLPFADVDDDEFEDTIARLAGAAQYPDENWISEKHAAVAESPLCLVRHCHIDAPMWVLGIKSTEVTARRGAPVEIANLDKGDTADEQALLAFAAKYKIEGDPVWLLCSMWA